MESDSKKTELEVEYVLIKYLGMDIESVNKLTEKTKYVIMDTLKGLISEESDIVKLPPPYEPKRNNKWMARFPEKLGIQEWWESESNRPSTLIAPDGGINYEPITFKFRDAIGPSTAQALNRLMIGMTDHIGDVQSKRIKEEFKEERERGFDYELLLIDSVGDIIEMWSIMGCKLVSIDYGKLNMADDGICEITMVLQPNKFILNY